MRKCKLSIAQCLAIVRFCKDECITTDELLRYLIEHGELTEEDTLEDIELDDDTYESMLIYLETAVF